MIKQALLLMAGDTIAMQKGIRNPHNFGFAETSDFKAFKDLGHFDSGVMKRTNFSEQKHGAVCWLTKKEARRLEKHWGNGKRR